MAAFLNITYNDNDKEIQFHIGEDLRSRYRGIKPQHVNSIQLDGDELAHAIDNLGAANVKRRVATYFGDEARRIVFNW
jgi:hypothetical protein